jgi:hypothetical protein
VGVVSVLPKREALRPAPSPVMLAYLLLAIAFS